MTQLALAVDATDELWTLDDLPTPEAPYVEVGSELVEVRSRFPSQIYSLTGQALPPRIRVRRGIAGTTKASHVQGSTLTPNYGLGSGEGGGAIAVTGGGTTVNDVTEIDLGDAPVTDEGGGVVGVSLNMRILSVPLAFNTPGLEDPGSVVASLVVGEVLLDMLLFTTTEWDDGSLVVEADGNTVLSGTLSGFGVSVTAFQTAHMSLSGLPEFTGVINDTPSPPAFASSAGDVVVYITGGPPTIGASTLILVIAITS